MTKRLVLMLALACCIATGVKSQKYMVNIDSLQWLLKNRYSSLSAEKIQIAYEIMSRRLPTDSVFETLEAMLVEEAEAARDRRLLCMTYHSLAKVYLSYFHKPAFDDKGKYFADKCMQIANSSGLNEFKVGSYLDDARYYLLLVQYQQALGYNNQAVALASAMGSDSLLCLSYSAIADTWEHLSNKLSEFQALLNERDFAEKSKIHGLMADSYYRLGQFYVQTDDFEKAKDYYSICVEKGRLWGLGISVFRGLTAFGHAYFHEKNENLGLSYYNHAQAYADSLGLPEMKLQVYFDLLNYYFNNGNATKGLQYLDGHPELNKFIRHYGIEYQLNKLYAELKRTRKDYDSARYFLDLAAPNEYTQQGNFGEKYEFSMQVAMLYKEMNHVEAQKKTLLIAKKYADSSQDLSAMKDVSTQLDSVYEKLGDYKNAQTYLRLSNAIRDSMETLGKQKDLLNIELESANKRAEQQKVEEAEATRKRNNLEYMGITAALATVFVILITLGVFKTSPSIIKGLGFFAFIFLFEFIVLLLDTQIHQLTHGEPWEVLGVKIVIIAMLLPLHHWLEEKMMHYLTYRAHAIKAKIFNKTTV